jgi:hypothetical protein
MKKYPMWSMDTRMIATVFSQSVLSMALGAGAVLISVLSIGAFLHGVPIW